MKNNEPEVADNFYEYTHIKNDRYYCRILSALTEINVPVVFLEIVDMANDTEMFNKTTICLSPTTEIETYFEATITGSEDDENHLCYGEAAGGVKKIFNPLKYSTELEIDNRFNLVNGEYQKVKASDNFIAWASGNITSSIEMLDEYLSAINIGLTSENFGFVR